MSNRQQAFEAWLKEHFQAPELTITPLARDASFRRYFAVADMPQWLAVDAPPEHEKPQEFVFLAEAFAKEGVRVPNVKAHDLHRGFMLVENLGPLSYLQVLTDNPAVADKLYRDALDKLIDLNIIPLNLETFGHPSMRQELDNCTEWFFKQYLQIDITPELNQLLDTTYEQLIAHAIAQPQVCIHRDYHSRNLIVREADNPGVIDFQDAMRGPLTYDVVSLLRDCYVNWPQEQVKTWARYFYDQYSKRVSDYTQSFEAFWDDFNWMGIQRHLKASFIFARKWLRDEDAGYLQDIPRTLNYIIEAGSQYPELTDFIAFMRDTVKPRLEQLQ